MSAGSISANAESSFRPVRNQVTGYVDITWGTESELNNAGFNILRRESRNGTFGVINPNQTALLANYPNPFNPETWIPYHLTVPVDVVPTIYAVDGRVVRRLDLGHQAAGFYQSKNRAAYWDGRNNVGERVGSGLYFYTLTAEGNLLCGRFCAVSESVCAIWGSLL